MAPNGSMKRKRPVDRRVAFEAGTNFTAGHPLTSSAPGAGTYVRGASRSQKQRRNASIARWYAVYPNNAVSARLAEAVPTIESVATRGGCERASATLSGTAGERASAGECASS